MSELPQAARQAADAYAHAVVLLGRCGEATHQADWAALAEHAGALSVAAGELSVAAGAVTREETPVSPAEFHAAAQQAIRGRQPDPRVPRGQ
ncbi:MULTISPECIES: hypothetical protein [Kitasatospora]|uniref:Uncharacterized protein n=1 Tax=Kitasatospora cystarginea TaxID=58350 RepID=A0ABN3E9S9_9ACTN